MLRIVLIALVLSFSMAFGQNHNYGPLNQEYLDSLASKTKAEEKANLLKLSQKFRFDAEAKKLEAENKAQVYGIRTKFFSSDSSFYELMELPDNGVPRYYKTNNANAAKTISTNRVYSGGGAGYSLTGSGVLLGEWDGGSARPTHQEMYSNGSSRITIKDNGTENYHAVHVSGTMIAAGVVSSAKGMAPSASLHSYDWNNDESEMASSAANDNLRASNHSYGYIAGFAYDGAWYWYGDASVSTTEDYVFGYYSSHTQDWDEIAYNAPNYLMCVAAGNDRSDDGDNGSGHYYWNNGWTWSTVVREGDGGSDGYDCINGSALAKNVLTVGAVYDITSGWSEPSDVGSTDFSSWGPADDGRIKPDISANGYSLYSSYYGANDSYSSMSGTSMATPSVTGSVGLIIEHRRDLVGSGNDYLSSTIKGLICHTADEAGSNDGPDYAYGWGLMNTESCIDMMTQNDNLGYDYFIQEKELTNGSTHTFTGNSTGTAPIKVTICWTDPEGTPVSSDELNNRTAMLVHDLDLRITKGATTYKPWVLDPDNPSYAATNDDNAVDNIEQVYIASPSSGEYTITVNHKGSLSSSQMYSIFITGLAADTLVVCQPTDSDSDGYYNISQLCHLAWISQNSSSWGWNFELDNDIDASATQGWNSGAGWSPIGNSTTYFTGEFKGNGYSIDGIYINRPDYSLIGLFGDISEANISNLSITNCDIDGDIYVGALSGKVENSSIESCFASGNIHGYDAVGGLCGYSLNSEIVSCNSEVTVSGDDGWIGGLIGGIGDSTTVEMCYSEGSVTGNFQVGGIIGGVHGSSSVTKCYSNVITAGTDSESTTYIGGGIGIINTFANVNNSFSMNSAAGTYNVGGFLGALHSGTLQNSYSIGAVTGTSSVGGLVGFNDSCFVSNSFWNTQTSGQSTSAGGTGKTTTQMKTDTTYTDSGWDFTNLWGINSLLNGGYPYLQGIGVGDNDILPYCLAATTYEDEYISNVQFGDIDNSSSWQGGVALYEQSTDLELNTDYEIIVTIGNPYSTDSIDVWIDLDQNDSFDDDEEFRLNRIDNTTFKDTINISSSSDFENGETRMRVRMTYNTNPQPCGLSGYGEVEDYFVNIINGGEDLAAPTLVSPANQSNNIDLSNITFKWNNISDALSYRIQISDSISFTSTVKDTIVADTSYVFNGNLNCLTNYYWRVNSMNEADTSVYSQVNTFKTKSCLEFESHIITTNTDNAHAVFAIDMDDDGDYDVLTASYNDATIAWYENNGSQTFTEHIVVTNANGANNVFGIDIDNDNDIDILSTSRNDNTTAWYENNGNMVFTKHIINNTLFGTYGLYAADIDDDGDIDVATATYDDSQINWFENDGSQNFTKHLIASLYGSHKITVNDLDDDGDMDIIASASGSTNKVFFFENDGNQSFTQQVVSSSLVWPGEVEISDLDSDGDKDIICSSPGNDKLIWLKNDGAENFTDVTIDATIDAGSAKAKDMDGDGDIDIICADGIKDWHIIYINDGNETFTKDTIGTNFNEPRGLFIQDIDSDSDYDVVLCSGMDDKTGWLESNASEICETLPLETTMLSAPEDDKTNTLTTLTLYWFNVCGSSNYNIQVSKNNNFATTVLDTNLKFTKRTLSGLDQNTTYYWRVRAMNATDTSAWSSVWSFTTKAADNHFTFNITTSSMTLIATTASTITFDNQNIAIGDEIGVFTQDGLCVGGEVWSGENIVFNAYGEDDYNDGLQEGEVMVFKIWDSSTDTEYIAGTVELEDVYGNPLINEFDPSQVWAEIITLEAATPLDAPTLVSPSNNATNQEISLTLDWNGVTGATSYDIQLSTSNTFSTTIVDENTTNTDKAVSGLSYETTYYWRARALNSGSTSDWSSVWSFTTEEDDNLLDPPSSWDFIQTLNNHSVIIQTSIDPQMPDRDIANGDAIGAFYLDGGVRKCAGWIEWTGENTGISVWGDDDQTEAKDGFATNEALFFKLWDAQEGEEYDAEFTVANGPSSFASGGFTLLGSLNAVTTKTFDIALKIGWNTVSSYIDPEYTHMDSVFKSIKNNILIAKDGNGKLYVPQYQINTIVNWNVLNGYQIYSTAVQDLTITGLEVVPESSPIYPKIGWSLVSYLRNSEMSSVTAMASVTDRNNLLIMKNGAGKLYVPSYSINTIGNMQMGDGYQIYVSSTDTLKYPANGASKVIFSGEILENEYLNPEFEATGSDMTLIIEANYEDATEIGVYNSNGTLIGSGVFQNGKAGVTIWGDDEYTEVKDGASIGELLNVKVLENGNLAEQEVEYSNGTELIYERGSFVIGKINVATVENKIKVTPNPATDKLTIELPNQEEATSIEIRDMKGKLMLEMKNEKLSKEIDISNFTNGTYFITVKTESGTYTEKFVKVK